MIEFLRLWVLFLFPLALIFLIYIMRKEYIPNYHDLLSKNQRTIGRVMLVLSRSAMVLLVLLALSGPFISEQKEVSVDPKVAMLYDRSPSMYPYDLNYSSWQQHIREHMDVLPINFRVDIPDALMQSAPSGNLVLISDLQTSQQKLGAALDILQENNATLHIVQPAILYDEASVMLTAQTNAIEGAQVPIAITVHKTFDDPLTATILIDGIQEEITLGDGKRKDTQIITRQFPVGFHNITVVIDPQEDYYEENNKYYHVLQVIPKPKITVLRSAQSPLHDVLDASYDVTYISSYRKADMLLIDDYAVQGFTSQQLEDLHDDVFEGMGLVVMGGQKSFEYGGYKRSELEELLPVTVGAGTKTIIKDINIVLVIDISGSTTQLTDGEQAMDIEKAIAIDLIEQIREDSGIGVVTFSNDADVIQGLQALNTAQRKQLYDKIAKLINEGNSNLDRALVEAYAMLANTRGSRNVIVISDGLVPSKATIEKRVEEARDRGIQTHTIDIGLNTNRYFLERVAIFGNGKYFRSDNKRSTSLIFRNDEKQDDSSIGLLAQHKEHFIMQKSPSINATITGYNQVIPKAKALTLVSTIYNNPVLVVGRYGLGRVAVLASGEPWARSLYAEPFLARTINWALGSAIDMPITVSYGDTIQIISKRAVEGFRSVDDVYILDINPSRYEPGIYNFGGASVAINTNNELFEIGFNEENMDMVKTYGGRIVNSPEEIVALATQESKEIKTVETSLAPYIIGLLFILFVLEVAVRRVVKMKK